MMENITAAAGLRKRVFQIGDVPHLRHYFLPCVGKPHAQFDEGILRIKVV
jgi:hypothetical protein